MRIVTRPDFDGVVCAVLLREAIDDNLPIFWAEPGDMQQGLVDVRTGDIVANLPFHDRCGSIIITPTCRRVLSRGLLRWHPPRRGWSTGILPTG